MNKPQLLIVDLGSQYTHVIKRVMLQNGFDSIILPPEECKDYLSYSHPKGIVLSGGMHSVYEADAPKPPKEVLSFGVPVLGICYGMQWIAHEISPKLVKKNIESKEYGKSYIQIERDPLFKGVPQLITVWASHGDSVEAKIPGFTSIAKNNDANEGFVNRENKIYGLQFHPEVTHTEYGTKILRNFAEEICNCKRDWQPKNAVIEMQEKIAAEVGTNNAILGLSGGVDSTTLAALIAPVLGKRLHAFVIDTGGLRKDELEEIRESFGCTGIRNLKIITADSRFFDAIGDEIDAKKKRLLFKIPYGKIFKDQIKKSDAKFIFQGTNAADAIESGQKGKSAEIKGHHNLGHDFGIKELTPFADIFKFQIRDIATALYLPHKIISRQPFPGPGLFLRVVGIPANRENIEIVRWADDIVKSILMTHKIYYDIAQVVTALIGVNTVGVKGDQRVYGPSIVVRAVKTTDFMTTEAFELPQVVRQEICSQLTRHSEIIRVWFDETTKPPATTEME
jgi:GMP synthase (glutamine-hydrolysing)